MLKANRVITIFSIFAYGFGTKKGVSHEGTLCESATVPAAVSL